MKSFIIFLTFIGCAFLYSNYKSEEQLKLKKAKEAACQANPSCMAARWNNDARFDSIINNTISRSRTGIFYFKGDMCTGNCSGHIAGYNWAQDNDIDDDYYCNGKSQSFIDGCMQFVAEKINEDEDEDEDQRDSCTPGRYGDC